MITYKLKIKYQDTKTLVSDIELISGDVGACRLEMEFYDNNERADISGCIVSVKARRADGKVLSDSGTVEDNKGIINLSNEIYAVPGELYLEVALADSAKNYITAKVILINVVEGLGETDETAKDNVSVYVSILNQTKTQLDASNTLLFKARELLGDTEGVALALDEILEIQKALIGGETE